MTVQFGPQKGMDVALVREALAPTPPPASTKPGPRTTAGRPNVGASQIAPILGLDPYRSPYDAWLELTGRVEPWEGNEATRRGIRLEPVLIDYYRELHPEDRVISGGEYRLEGTPILVHPDARAYSPVKGTAAERVIEAKTAAIEAAGFADTSAWGEPGTDAVPAHYLVQVMAQMAAVGCGEASVVALIGGRGFAEYVVPRNETLVGRIVEITCRWYDVHVTADTPPAIDGPGTAPDLDSLKRVIRQEGRAVEIERSLVTDWLRSKDALKGAEQVEAHARARMLAALDDAESGTVDGEAWITYRRTSPKTPKLDAKRVKAEHPDVFSACSELPKGYRVLRATKAAEWSPHPPQDSAPDTETGSKLGRA